MDDEHPWTGLVNTIQFVGYDSYSDTSMWEAVFDRGHFSNDSKA